MMTIPRIFCIRLFIYICLICNFGFISTKEDIAADIGVRRNAKAFSLFSVVTFKNEECTSESTFAGGVVQGTCYSATECSDKSGMKSGNCASGFGVCCVFISNIGTATISENRTWLQSSLFPTVETLTAAITYTINKMQSDICQLRLDFDTFNIVGPTATDEQGHSDLIYTNCGDMLTTTLSSNAVVPILCGTMSGSHLYMDMGFLATDTAQLALTFAAAPTAALAMRSWRIKTSQIPCWADYRAPDGCHQYFYGSAFGQIWSPNFRTGPAGAVTGALAANYQMDLMGQDLKMCIRREKGMCCTLYQVCNYDPDGVDMVEVLAGGVLAEGTIAMISPGYSFNIDCWGASTGGNANGQACGVGFVDEDCTNDYVEIPDSSTGTKNFGAAVQVNSRYCCNKFGYVPGDPDVICSVFSHAPVYDCTEPFEVNYHTDTLIDDMSPTITNASPATIIARGLCLLYKQEAC